MEKLDLNEGGGVEIPFWLLDRNHDPDPTRRGIWISFTEPEPLVPMETIGPYPNRGEAVAAADRLAHEAIRAEATSHLLDNAGDDQ